MGGDRPSDGRYEPTRVLSPVVSAGLDRESAVGVFSRSQLPTLGSNKFMEDKIETFRLLSL